MKNAHVLLVEDDEIVAALVATNLAGQGCQVTQAEDGQAAWELIDASATEFDAILLDRDMPRMDGLTLLGKLRARPDTAQVPVIMATALSDKASILEGLQAGAYYYLTKPLQIELLLVVVQAAIDQSRAYRQLQQVLRHTERALHFLSEATFHYRGIDEVDVLAGLLARLCPQPDRVVLGLHELMINAVEHGNLGIDYAGKSQLLLEGDLPAELARRQQLPENAEKRVTIHFQRTPEEIRFTIEDQGNGFAWNPYLDFDPERIFDPHGRGIAIARATSFDTLEYLGKGNRVRVSVALTQG
ncbi:MAG: response regulator [Chromatiaceae bacterium]|nr:response regulator [Chromatiaceae bacterium]